MPESVFTMRRNRCSRCAGARKRWLLKLLCGMRAGGHAAALDGSRYDRAIPDLWVRILFGLEPMPASWGVYINVEVGQNMQFGVRELKAAPISVEGTIVGVVADIFGWRFVLVLSPARPERARGAVNPTSMYRPTLLQTPTPSGTKAIYLHWEPGDRDASV